MRFLGTLHQASFLEAPLGYFYSKEEADNCVRSFKERIGVKDMEEFVMIYCYIHDDQGRGVSYSRAVAGLPVSSWETINESASDDEPSGALYSFYARLHLSGTFPLGAPGKRITSQAVKELTGKHLDELAAIAAEKWGSMVTPSGNVSAC
jgi:hypothetical protein